MIKIHLLSVAAVLLCFFISCKQENNLSELEQRKQELENKKLALQDKKAIAALEEELKTVDAEMKTLTKTEVKTTSTAKSLLSGTITGGSVVMRASNSVQSAKLGNFVKNEKVAIVDQSASSPGNEAIANQDIPLYKKPGNGEFAYTLPKGKAVIIDSYNSGDDVYSINYQHPDLGKLYAMVPAGSLDHLSGETWYFVRRSNGDQGWVTGKFLSVN